MSREYGIHTPHDISELSDREYDVMNRELVARERKLSDREYIVSDDTSLGRDDTEMREEAAEYFSHNPGHRRCGFIFVGEGEIEDIERDEIPFIDIDNMYIYLNKNREE